MYRIRNKQGKVVAVQKQTLFYSYEEARQAVRKKIRAMVKLKKGLDVGFFDGTSRNPSRITGVGLRIVLA